MSAVSPPRMSARTKSSPGSIWPANSEVELTPQGTLAERLRAGGAGIPAFYTPAGVGSPVSATADCPGDTRPTATIAVASPPKETRVFNGTQLRSRSSAINRRFRTRTRQMSVTPQGNLVFDKTAMNFNPLAAMAGRITIAQVEELRSSPVRSIPASVHCPASSCSALCIPALRTSRSRSARRAGR